MIRHRRPDDSRVQGRTVALLAALLVLPSLVQAQTTAFWNLFGLRSGFCIEFLISPDQFRLTPFQPGLAAPASQAGRLAPVIARLVTQADSLASWYPSTLCLIQADSSRTGGDTQHHKDRPVSVLFWTVAPVSDSLPASAVLFATEGGLRGTQDLSGSAEVTRFEATLDVDAETGERVITAEIDETGLGWDGLVLPDTVAAGPIRDQSWQLVGKAPYWRVDFHAAPDTRRKVSGSLRVRGEGLLARLLLASPIRWVGEYWEGGTAHFGFSRGL